MLPLKIVTISLNGLLAATYTGIAILLIVGLVQQRGKRFNALGLILSLVTLTSGLSYLAHALIIGLSPWHPGKVTYTVLSAVSLVPATIFLLLYRRYEDLFGGVRLLNETRRQLRERSAQLAALVELSAHLSRFHSLTQVLESALARCLALSGFDAGAFYLRLEEGQPLRLHAHAQFPAETAALLAHAENEPENWGLPMSPLQVHPVESATGPGARVLDEAGWIQLLDLPVRGAGGLFGVVRLASPRAVPLKPQQLSLLEAVGRQIGVVIDSVRFLEVQTRFQHELQQQVAQATAELRSANETLIAEERRWQTLVENMPNGLLLLDAEDRLATVNQRAEALFGLTRHELLGHSLTDSGLPTELVASLGKPPLVGENGQWPMGEWEAAASEEKTLRGTVQHSRPAFRNPKSEIRNGYEQRYDVALTTPTACALQVHTAQVIDDAGRYLGRVFVFHDVTREREIDQMKSDFIDLVSHELRTPLTNIIGFVSLMLEGETGEINEAQRRSLASVQRQARRLSALITDLLDVSRIEAGQVTMRQESVDLAAVAEAVLQELQPQAREKNLTVHFMAAPNLPSVRGDTERLSRVFTNLLGNAFKFTPPGGEVSLTLNMVNGELQSRVRDTGPGIPGEDLPRVFDKFFQVERVATRKSGGTGLGLSIVRGIVEAHGGRVWANSVVGEGTVFTFALPIQPQEADIADEIPAVLPPEDAPLVLVVAPDLAAADGLLARLHQRGYRTLVIQEPDQAAVQADAVGPAAILCDDETLERHGDLLAQLQNDPHTRAIPVLRWREGEAVEDQLAQVCSVKTG